MEKRVPFLVDQGGLFSAGQGHRKGTRRVRPCPRLAQIANATIFMRPIYRTLNMMFRGKHLHV